LFFFAMLSTVLEAQETFSWTKDQLLEIARREKKVARK